MEPDAQRAALAALVEQRGISLARLSRVLGRNPAYLQQFMQRGTPRMLAEADRGRLARYLDVPESVLGGPGGRGEGLVAVARLDVDASAGPGRIVQDRAAAPHLLSESLLRLLGVRPAAASIIRVAGDSMEPLLHDGDEILVDHDRTAPGAGVFVLRLDGELMVKRLRRAVGGIEVVSDNPAYPPRCVTPARIAVVGQVVWLGRALV